MKYDLKDIGTRLKKLPVALLDVGDIIYYEGPMLSYCIDNTGNHYLMKWSEMDDHFNRWMLIQLTRTNLVKYLNGKLTLLSLIRKNEMGAVWLIDIDSDANYKGIYVVNEKNIPEGYLPGDQSYFLEKYATDFAIELKEKLNAKVRNTNQMSAIYRRAVAKLYGSSYNGLRRPAGLPVVTTGANTTVNSLIHDIVDLPIMILLHAARNHPQTGGSNANSSQNATITHYLSGKSDLFFYNLQDNWKADQLIEFVIEARRVAEEHPDEYADLMEQWSKAIRKESKQFEQVEHIFEKTLAESGMEQ
ncbi:MAG: hypothetical protein EBZ77_06300 [Chitinophagia bacterium]|nr:hypothetical protein [Chitinophagia bacterium]